MVKASPIYESFNAGELSPLLEGRTDYAKYKKGLKLCKNFLPLVQGPLLKRPGTHRVANTKDNGEVVLVEFEFSTTQAYVIEFGNQYCRFYKDHALITLTAQDITGVTKANPAVVTYNGSDTYANGDRVVITGVVGMTELNNREFTVANVNAGANTFELSGVNSTGYGTYTSGGSVAEVYEIATPYTLADVKRLQFAQSADVLYMVCNAFKPRKLSRTGHTSWTLDTISFTDGPYLSSNSTATTLTPGAATGSGVTLTASSTTGINGGDGFKATDVGRFIRVKQGTIWGWCIIVGFTSTTVVTVDIQRTFTDTTAKATWRLGAWSDTTGWPAAVTFYGNRLTFGGPTAYPDRIDGSMVGDFENMSPSTMNSAGTDNTTVADDNAYTFSLSADDVNAIMWLRNDENGLIAGTAGGEWLVRASNANEALTPSNVKADRSTTEGCSAIAPVRAGKALLFAQRKGRKLHELAYVFEDNGLRAPDMTTAAEHMLRGGLADMAYQAEPQSVVWMPRADGTLIGFTYEREQEVLAWHRHVAGGAFGSGQAVVETSAAIPAPANDADELWIVTKRTVNGGTVRTVEYMDPIWNEERDKVDAFFVDCGATYSGASTNVVSGLNWLEGQTVEVLADGAAHSDCVVTAGKVTLSRNATKVQVGLGYTSEGWTERNNDGATQGTAQGKIKRVAGIVARLWQTGGTLLFGSKPDATNLEKVIFRKTSDPMGEAVPLFDGDTKVNNTGGYETEGRIYFKHSGPFPCCILALMPEVRTEER